MTAKLDAVLRHRPEPLERENLKASGVRENRTIPAHEAMQSAELPNQLVARPKVQMIRVPKDHLRAHRPEIVRIKRLHCRLRSHGHEGRRIDRPVRRGETPSAPRSTLRVDEE